MFPYACIFLVTVVSGNFVAKPADVVAISGVEPATFECAASFTVAWSFKNLTLDSKPRGTGATVKLIIPEVDFDRAGTYICEDSDGIEREVHSAQLMVVELHNINAVDTSQFTFEIVSGIDYSLNARPRIACVEDIDESKFINVSERVGTYLPTVGRVSWTSENLNRTLAARTFKCVVEVSASDSYSRTFEQVIRVHGIRVTIEKVDYTRFIAIPFVAILAIITCLSFILYIRSARFNAADLAVSPSERAIILGV